MQHPALRAWIAWRNGEPMWFDHPGKMPLSIALGFEYLCERYGRQSLSPSRKNHDALVAELTNQIEVFNSRKDQIPTAGF